MDRDYKTLLGIYDYVMGRSGNRETAMRAVFESDTAMRTSAMKKEMYMVSSASREIIAKAAMIHGVAVSKIVGPSRLRSVVLARDEVSWLLRQSGLSYPQVGAAIGGRDHSTAMAAVRRFEARMAKD